MFSTKNLIIIALSFSIVVAAGLGFKKIKEAQMLNSASYALSQIKTALENKDTTTFKKHVDTRALAESILNQVLSEKSTPQKEDGDFWSSIKDMGNNLGERLTEYLKPELTNSLETQIMEFAQQGKFNENYDLTNIYGRTPMLQKVWHDLAGNNFEFRGISDISEIENSAKANVNFYRKDLDFSSSITLKMEKREDVWVLVGLDGLSQTLTQLETLRVKMIQARNLEIENKIQASLNVENIEKSTGVANTEFGGKRVLLRIAFVNTADIDIQSFKATVSFKNIEGEELKVVSIEDSDVIPSGEIIEKSWPMNINPLSPSDNFIFDHSQEDLQMEVHIHSLTFVDGTKLEPTKI